MQSQPFIQSLVHPYKRVLVTGGHGFIGSYVAKALLHSGNLDLVRIVDLQPKPSIFQSEEISHETLLGDLLDPYILQSSLVGVELVLHFAANMGGMGTIHSQNDFEIYSQNHATEEREVPIIRAPGALSRLILAQDA